MLKIQFKYLIKYLIKYITNMIGIWEKHFSWNNVENSMQLKMTFIHFIFPSKMHFTLLQYDVHIYSCDGYRYVHLNCIDIYKK